MRLKGGSWQIVPLSVVQLAAGSPARSRVPTRSRRPRLWSGTRPQPVTPPPVGGGSPVAGCLGARRWQNAREMRSPASDRGKISPRCVPGRRSVAAFSLHAFPKGPRTGKAPVRGNISPPCIRNELALARYARHVSEKPRKPPFGNAPREDLAREGPFSLHWPLESCMVRESCQGPHCTGPPNLARESPLHKPLESRIVRRSCHPLAIFAFRWRGALP